MPYTPTTWVNGTAPGISATNLNKIETGIVDAVRKDGTEKMTGDLVINKLPASVIFQNGSGAESGKVRANGAGALIVSATGVSKTVHIRPVSDVSSTGEMTITDLGTSLTTPLTASRFISTQTTGTAPLTVASTTVVTNLNVDRVDGIHFRLTGEVLERSTDGVIWKGVGNLIDVTSLTPLTKDASAITGTGALQTILSITGEGFLESFYGLQIGAQAGFTVKITVDGMVKVLLVVATAANAIGVVSKNDIVVSGTSTTQGSTLSGAREQNSMSFDAVNSDSAAFKEYPTTDSTAGIILLGDSKIYFTTSLLLEISCSASTNYKYHYSGGFK